jgi:hypothetical protein
VDPESDVCKRSHAKYQELDMPYTIQVSRPTAVGQTSITGIPHVLCRGNNRHRKNGIPYLLVFAFLFARSDQARVT